MSTFLARDITEAYKLFPIRTWLPQGLEHSVSGVRPPRRQYIIEVIYLGPGIKLGTNPSSQALWHCTSYLTSLGSVPLSLEGGADGTYNTGLLRLKWDNPCRALRLAQCLAHSISKCWLVGFWSCPLRLLNMSGSWLPSPCSISAFRVWVFPASGLFTTIPQDPLPPHPALLLPALASHPEGSGPTGHIFPRIPGAGW